MCSINVKVGGGVGGEVKKVDTFSIGVGSDDWAAIVEMFLFEFSAWIGSLFGGWEFIVNMKM